MARLLDGLSVIFPFEVDCYDDTSLEATFVGHPCVQSEQDCELVYEPHGKVLLLAGSRVSNVKRVLPVMLESYSRFIAAYEPRDALLIYPSDTIRKEIEVLLEQYPKLKDRLELVPNIGRIGASAVLTTSGTMSLRCGLAGIPGRIVHTIHFLSFVLGKLVLKIPYIGIANLLLEKPFYPEFTQYKAKPEILAEELHRCISDQSIIEQTQADSKELRLRLEGQTDDTPWSWLAAQLNT